jgi:hypothetical protein
VILFSSFVPDPGPQGAALGRRKEVEPTTTYDGKRWARPVIEPAAGQKELRLKSARVASS